MRALGREDGREREKGQASKYTVRNTRADTYGDVCRPTVVPAWMSEHKKTSQGRGPVSGELR